MLGALAAAARAENLTVHIPFPFEAAGKSLPAGDYTVEPIGPALLVMCGATAAGTVTFAASPDGWTDAANPGLSFVSGPEQAVLSRVRLDGGLTFAVMPAKGTVALAHK